MEEIEKCDCPHFLILFRDSKLQFRALYAYYPDTEEVKTLKYLYHRKMLSCIISQFHADYVR